MTTKQFIQRIRMAVKALTADEVMTISPDKHGMYDILSVKSDNWDIRLINDDREENEEMTLNAYQSAALETAIYPDPIVYPTLGLNGEAGEVADKVKKVLRDGSSKFTGEIKEAIMYEVGDVLWYVATLSHDLGYTLEEVAERNYDKLKSRQLRGMLHGSGDNR